MDPTTAMLRAAVAEVARRLAQLAQGERPDGWSPVVADPAAEGGDGLPADGPLAGLAHAAQLDALDCSLLVTALAPAIDARFGEIFASLAGDGATSTGPRVATVDGLLVVNGRSPWDPEVRHRLGPLGPLRRAGLLEVSPAASLLDAEVTVPESVIAALLGSASPDPALVPLVARTASVECDEVIEVARALQSGWWNVWLLDAGGGGLSVGASALAVLDAPAVTLDLQRLAPGATLADVLPAAVREAALVAGGVVVGPVDPVRDRAALAALPVDPVRPTVLVSAHAWNPAASAAVPVTVGPLRITPPHRAAIWDVALAAAGIELPGAADELSGLRLAPEQILTASVAAAGAADVAGDEVRLHHLRSAALAHGTSRLVDLARRVVPRATFEDLVAPPELLRELRSIPGRHRTRHIVRDEWGLGGGGGRGVGLTCLFAGPSGTGKTLSAEVVANALGVDLFIIDLSQIVDKYIGETEKNLERVFAEAEGVNGLLLFDEADALFGKRSDVKSAHDRHANVEVAYLLQRMERYDGVAVLTTNYRGNIDEAFSRRLDVVCSFADPEEDERIELWRRHLPPSLPQTDDVDVDLLARHLPIAGGVIRNITLTAAHAAAVDARAVSMADLVLAAVREYRKMGRLFTAPELLRLIPTVSASDEAE